MEFIIYVIFALLMTILIRIGISMNSEKLVHNKIMNLLLNTEIIINNYNANRFLVLNSNREFIKYIRLSLFELIKDNNYKDAEIFDEIFTELSKLENLFDEQSLKFNNNDEIEEVKKLFVPLLKMDKSVREEK